jgi:hypothetical protein
MLEHPREDRQMKAKTIKKVIQDKMESWWETIEDLDLQEMVRKNTIVTGGCIASMLLKESISDFDIYFRDRETTRKVALYYVDRFKPVTSKGIQCLIRVDESKDDRIGVIIQSAGVASEEGTQKEYEYFEATSQGEAGNYVGDVMNDPGEIEDLYQETQSKALEVVDDGKPKYRPVFISTNAITLSHRIQLITRFYGKPDEIHANYDFVHCTNYWSSWDNELVLRKEALEALLTKELKYVGSKYPICSLIRIRKFIQRGWTINAGQILKMVMQASELDLKNIRVLQDQLTGVDAAYFCEILAKLKEGDPEKINSAYLCEIVDRLF